MATPGSNASTEELKARAVQISDDGVTAYKAGRYQDAMAFFEEAYGVFPAPEVLFNLSHAAMKAGACEKALDSAHKILSTLSARAEPSLRESASTWAATVEADCPEVEIESEPSGAALWWDGATGEPAGMTKWRGRLSVGTHAVVLRREGFADKKAKVHVSAGQTVRMSIPLVALAEPQPSASPPGQSPPSPVALAPAAPPPEAAMPPVTPPPVVQLHLEPPPPPPAAFSATIPAGAVARPEAGRLPLSQGHFWSYVVLGTGAALAAGAAGTGISSLNEVKVRDQNFGDPTAFKAANQKAIGLATTTNVLWAAAAGALVTSVALWIVEWQRRPVADAPKVTAR